MPAQRGFQLVSGASRGIGLALTQQLLRQGGAGVHAAPRVVAASRAASRSEELQRLQEQHRERLVLVDMDVSCESSIQVATAGLDGPCELLVHGAALMHPSGKGENSIARLEQTAFAQVLATNVVGPALLTGALYKQLRAAAKLAKVGEGAAPKVIAIGAGVGSVGTNQAGGWYSYRVSKTALNALMMNISIEGGRHGISAATLYPEMVDTAFAAPYLAGNPYAQLRTPEETAERMLQIVSTLQSTDSGRFLNIWSGEDIPW